MQTLGLWSLDAVFRGSKYLSLPHVCCNLRLCTYYSFRPDAYSQKRGLQALEQKRE